MNLYIISQDSNINYDTFDSALVAAESEEDARVIAPCDQVMIKHEWTTPENVKVQLVGKALPNIKSGVLLASYNAG